MQARYWRSEGVALTATEALNQILAIEPQAVREMQDSDALFVKIVDIQVGKGDLEDPQHPVGGL